MAEKLDPEARDSLLRTKNEIIQRRQTERYVEAVECEMALASDYLARGENMNAAISLMSGYSILTSSEFRTLPRT